jgi:branched-subunit amino acid transport protein
VTWLPIAGLIGGMLLVTYATRYTMIALLGRVSLSRPARRWLEFVPAAVFTALIVPAIVSPRGHVDLSPGNHHLWAGLICALVGWRTRHTLWTIVAGLVAFWLLRWIGV